MSRLSRAVVQLEQSEASGLYVIPYKNMEKTVASILVARGKKIKDSTDVVECLELISGDYEVAHLDDHDVRPPPVFPKVCYKMKSDFGQHLVCPPVTCPRPRIDVHFDIPLVDFVAHFGRYVLQTSMSSTRFSSCGVALTAFIAVRGRLQRRTTEKENPEIVLDILPGIEKVNNLNFLVIFPRNLFL
jgi:hypothetical protein